MLAQVYPPSTVQPESNEPVAAKPGNSTSTPPGFSGWLRHRVYQLAGHFAGFNWGEAVRPASVRLTDRAIDKTENDSDDSDEFYDASSTIPRSIDPEHREQRQKQKQRIMTAFQGGKLHCRGVNLNTSTDDTKKGLELDYQRAEVEPRPAVCLKQGLPVKLFEAELQLGLSPVRELLCFKMDVLSYATKRNIYTQYPRQLLPNREALLDKIEEESAYHTSLYRNCTSGHLMPDGRHKSGHSRIKRTEPCTHVNESITQGYRKEQYQCVIIGVPFTLKDLCQQFHAKARLEKELKIDELPLAFYHIESGNIQEILYLDELGITQKTLPELAANIDRLIKFKSVCCCPELDSVLSTVLPSRLLQQLMTLPEQVLIKSAVGTPPLKAAALKAVQNKNLDALKLCLEHGADLTATYEIKGRYMNLLEFLYHEPKPYGHAKVARCHELGKFLYQQGCRVPITNEVFCKYPRLAVFMFGQGERYYKNPFPSQVINELLEEWVESRMTASEFKIALDTIKKEFTYNQLVPLYESYLGNKLLSYARKEKELYEYRTHPDYLLREDLSEHTQQKMKQKLFMLITFMASTGLHLNPESVEAMLRLNYQEESDSDKPYHGTIKQLFNETLEALKQSQATDQAQTAKQALEQSMSGSHLPRPDQPSSVHPEFIWLHQLLQQPPDTVNKRYHQLAQLAMRHYYQTPHPSQLMKMMSCKPEHPAPLRQFHAEDHIARCQVLAEGIMPLLIQHDDRFEALFQNNPDLYDLIPLAMVYHDVVAEVEDKEQEESRAAELFERDIIASGQYPAALVTLVANALRNKETDIMASKPPYISDQRCSEEERLVRHLVRLSDRLDYIRVATVPPDWTTPAPTGQKTVGFDIRKLDIPDNLKANADFMTRFGALMEGAKALAYTTGGAPTVDSSDSGSYLRNHDLVKKVDTRQYKVSRAVYAYDSVMETLDDNVRRGIAQQAGLPTCQADHDKTTLNFDNDQAECLSVDANGREYLTAIHDERELRQVRLPDDMTVLEKLMFEQQGSDCLPEDKRKQVEREVDRLRKSGIQPPLGTLTQETLADERAQTTLRDHYDIEVVPEERFCGYDDDDCEKKIRLLVPRQKRMNHA